MGTNWNSFIALHGDTVFLDCGYRLCAGFQTKGGGINNVFYKWGLSFLSNKKCGIVLLFTWDMWQHVHCGILEPGGVTGKDETD